jgi:hypothetical protein
VGLPLLAALTLILGCTVTSGTAYADPAPERSAASSVFSDSTTVRCASGTTDLGVHDGYHLGVKIPVRLCRVDNLPSTGPDSDPYNPFYLRSGTVGANGHAIVNSRVSGAVQTMVRDMKAAGLTVRAASTYRSMKHQQSLCDGNPRCRGGDHRFLARPGWSNHQMGLAIDFFQPGKTGSGVGCGAPDSDPGNPVWRWLHAHAAHYGFKQYADEAWHWEPVAVGRC